MVEFGLATTYCDCDCYYDKDKDDLRMSTMTVFAGLRFEHKARAATWDPSSR